MAYIAYHFDLGKQNKRMTELFQAMDTDKSGFLSRPELHDGTVLGAS